jgi:hypothetical protein
MSAARNVLSAIIRGMGELPRITLSGELEGDYVVLLEHPRGALRIAPEQRGAVPTVVALERTSTAAPAQWEGSLDDGRSLYVRYRHGLLRVGVGDGIEAAHTNSFPKTALHCAHIGPELDGYMDFAQLRAELYGLLEFPAELVVDGEREDARNSPRPGTAISP